MIVAASEPLAGVAIDSFLQFGTVGVVAIVLGVLTRSFLQREQTRSELLIKREQDRSDRLDAEVVRLNNLIQEKTIPALVMATEAIGDSQRLLQQLQFRQDNAISRKGVDYDPRG